MKKSEKILLEFIDSFDSGELNAILHAGFNTIFEDSVAATSADMYSDGVHHHHDLTTSNADEGTNTYLGSEQENFNGDQTDLIDELDLFNLDQVTIHSNDESLKAKFHGTNTYQTLVPKITGLVDSNKLMKSHMNQNDGGVKILKA